MSISLVDMTKSDLVFVNSIRNLENTRSQLENQQVISIEDTILWFEEKKPKWKIIKNESDERIGYVRTSKDTGISICIGCDIHPEYRRKGYATEAYKNLINELYKAGYRVIWLRCFYDNIARFLYEKLGFISINHDMVHNRKYITMIHRR
jgi:predicted GNAT family acetyltransferase